DSSELITTNSESDPVIALEQRLNRNKRNGKESFESFTDYELIYYYIYRHSNVFKGSDSRKDSTKNAYKQILLNFYNLLLQILNKDGYNIQEGQSVFLLTKDYHLNLYIKALQQYISPKTGKSYKKSTIHQYVTVMRQFMKWLYNKDILEKDLTKDLPSVALSPEDLPDRDLYLDTVRDVLSYYKERNLQRYAIILCGAVTGLRLTATANIKMSDITYEPIDGKYFYVLKVKEKRDKIRYAVIHPEIFNELVSPKKRLGKPTMIGPGAEGYLFEMTNGKKYSTAYLSKSVSAWFDEYTRETNQVEKNITYHHLRHFYSIYAFEKLGKSPEEIRNALLHKSIDTTNIYLSNVLKKENDIGKDLNVSDFLI
ncbi:site-specific integrase, partial [Enterococcus faecium]|nr:site-specific integrase [Enterococcus faecium]